VLGKRPKSTGRAVQGLLRFLDPTIVLLEYLLSAAVASFSAWRCARQNSLPRPYLGTYLHGATTARTLKRWRLDDCVGNRAHPFDWSQLTWCSLRHALEALLGKSKLV
jgi:hypothetical protein